jgi:tetratricopeptide (TPR) repeat protein
MPVPAPKVSVIVRSAGRPELGEALAAIAAQTCPAIEVVVVDASGGKRVAPPACGAFPVVFVAGDEPRSRPVAANAGLGAARGEYIGFLDDDDLIAPGHVSGLVTALDAQGDYAVAYAHAREVVQGRGTVAHRAYPYSRLLLFQDCFLPNNAVLFRREVGERCRFDETLEVCEDWDFWLQASAVSDFLEVPQETAIYRSDLGVSGMGGVPGANRDFAKYERYRAMVAAKWRAEGERLARAVEADFERAGARYAAGDRDGAAAAASSVLARYPYHVGALCLSGTMLALGGDFAAAAQRFERAAAEAPDDAEVRFNLAQALERLGRAAEAQEHYRRALELDPAHAHARARLLQLESPFIRSHP